MKGIAIDVPDQNHMKNQYFGDINDFKKYGLLRILSSGGLRTAVCWMLTDADSGNDGKFIEYLREPQKWRAYNAALFDSLVRCVHDTGIRTVKWAHQPGFLPSTVFYDALLTDKIDARQQYFERFLEMAQGNDLVFFDPDNGLEVRSTAVGRKGSSKYVYWDELTRTFTAGYSILMYQHFPRIDHKVYLKRLAEDAGRRTGMREIISFSTANVVFLLIPQPRHLERLQERSAQVRTAWGTQIEVTRHVYPSPVSSM